MEILLTSEKFMKSVLPISDNIAGKYIQSSIREAQEIGLKGIVGTALLTAVKNMIAANTLEGVYKEFVDNAQYYLAYQAAVELQDKVSYKIANMGVVKTSDENLSPASADEIEKVKADYQNKADHMCYELQGWLLENAARMPELDECACHKIHANLKSAATCGLWLGGARGKGPVCRVSGIGGRFIIK